MNWLRLAPLGLWLMAGCGASWLYEEQHELPAQNWPRQLVQEFALPGVPSQDAPQVVLTLRADNTYPYSNLYLRYYLRQADSLVDSDLVELTLFDPKTGQPTGAGISQVYSYEFNLLRLPKLRQDTLHLQLVNEMRDSTLVGLYEVGISLEPAP